MNLSFANGTKRQQTQWRQTLHRLLNLPFEDIPLTVTVSFVDPNELEHGESFALAATKWSYGSAEAVTQVRNDAPGYANADASLKALAASLGLTYNADLHYNETAVHETAHALYAALPEEFRVAIAKLFGASSDSTSELFPSGAAWEDKPGEAIADTFKEAFLPRRFRVFGNRTNIKLSYSEFPRFRRLFREGVENIAIPGGGPTIAEQMAELPLIDNLERGPSWSAAQPTPPEGAEIELPWEQWAPAEHPGFHYKLVFASPYYRAAPRQTFGEGRLPRVVGALYTDLVLADASGKGFGATVNWVGEQVGLGKNPGEVNVFAAAALAGSGYKLVAIRVEQQPEAEFTYRYRVRLERWTAGAGVVVAEAEDVFARDIGSDWGISVMNGRVTAWVRGGEVVIPGEPVFGTFVEACSAKDSTYSSGFCGIGLIRNNDVGNHSLPVLNNFRAGVLLPGQEEVIGGPIAMPSAEVGANGFSRGTHPTKRPTAGFIH